MIFNLFSILFLIGGDTEIKGKKCKHCGKESCYIVGATHYICPYCFHLIVVCALVNDMIVMVKDREGYTVLKTVKRQ